VVVWISEPLRCRDFDQIEKLGLKGLAETVLNQSLDKSFKLRVSDWEADYLTKGQIDYAADDALVAVDIYKEIVRRKIRHQVQPVSALIENDFWARGFSMCQGLVDATFKAPSPHFKTTNSNRGHANAESKFVPKKTKAYAQRATALYENCHLMAPDGQILSTCNSAKATWYVDKGLADVVSKEGEQLKVRLRFEPAGRPIDDGIYYAQEKENKCVVCGSEDSFNLRKNIIPQEYRKHFPGFLKDHSSHDVLLMCLPCHQLANLKDHDMRLKLAVMCEAPIGTMLNIRCFEDTDLKKVKSFGKALLQTRNNIPDSRRQEMQDYLASYFGVKIEDLDKDLLQKAATLDASISNDNYKPHGMKVVEWMHSNHSGDLGTFERMWRHHFIETMQPKFLPNMWSVDHNHKNVQMRMEQGDTKFLRERQQTMQKRQPKHRDIKDTECS